MTTPASFRIFLRIIHFITLLSCALCIIALAANPVSAQDDLSILSSWKFYENSSNALYHEFAREAYRYLDERDKTIAGIENEKQWQQYVSSVREKLRAAFGPLPSKTPLNARITGTLEHEGILIEKIIYESRPGFWVTGCIFKSQEFKGRLPAVLYVCGHTSDGFRGPGYQHFILNLARKGFLVFAIDPVGQGERILYYDEEKGSSRVGGSTLEHSYAGLQYLLIGRTMAMVRLWDGICAIDYLVERPDVDPDRIGVHGRSGGGTMSSYLGAMDDRVAAAAPECYITSFRRLLQSIGPQDAEQNLLGQISRGLDHGDFLIARDSRPTLVVTTTRDFFSIQGARETVRSIRSIMPLKYRNNLTLVEDDAPHRSTRKNREAVYDFFMEAFNVTGNAMDEDIPPADPKALQVTRTGQTTTSGSITLHDVIREDAVELIKKLERERTNKADYFRRVSESARELSGFSFSYSEMNEPIFCGRFIRDGYAVEKYILDGENGLPLPLLLFIPDGGERYPALLYINPEGKEADAETGGEIEKLVRSGFCVCAPDLPGYGELAVDIKEGDSVIEGVSYNIVFGAQLIGRSITGIQAGHIVRVCRFLNSRDDVIPGNITGISKGVAGPALMHAAVMERSIDGLALIQSPLSWASVVNNRYYDNRIGATIVPSALTSYDLVDLLCVFAPGKLLVYKPVGGDANAMAEHEIDKLLKVVVESCYAESKDRCMLVKTDDKRSLDDVISVWLSKH